MHNKACHLEVWASRSLCFGGGEESATANFHGGVPLVCVCVLCGWWSAYVGVM